MDLTYKYELKLKEKMHQRINKHRIIDLDSNQIKKPKLSTKSALHGFDNKLGETWLRQNTIGFRN